MGTITVDEVNYDTELLSDEGNNVLLHLMQADTALKEASTVQLIADLKTNHLTEEAIATEEVEANEE